MKIALTVWGNRISPVFDSAQTLLVAQIENKKIVQKSYESFDSKSANLSDNLKKMGVSVLICGAISEMLANVIESSKIKLIPFVTGTAVAVLELYLSNKPVSSAYFMPGCKRQCGRLNDTEDQSKI
ncbi:MAG: NifB/NifX family molybdenum-iron cluster-binding protein [Pseudomonadota bacterium]